MKCSYCKGLGVLDSTEDKRKCPECGGAKEFLPMLNSVVGFRIREEERAAAQEYIKGSDLYDSVSHFARAAWIEALRNKCGYSPGLVKPRLHDGNTNTHD